MVKEGEKAKKRKEVHLETTCGEKQEATHDFYDFLNSVIEDSEKEKEAEK